MMEIFEKTEDAEIKKWVKKKLIRTDKMVEAMKED